MARFAGKDLVVLVENSAAAEVAFTFVTGVTVNHEHEDHETRGDTEVASIPGQLVSEVIVDYEYDTTATTGNQAVLDGIKGDNSNPRFVRVRPTGTGGGQLQFSMDSILLRFGPTGPVRGETIIGQAVFKNHAAASADPAWAAQ